MGTSGNSHLVARVCNPCTYSAPATPTGCKPVLRLRFKPALDVPQFKPQKSESNTTTMTAYELLENAIVGETPAPRSRLIDGWLHSPTDPNFGSLLRKLLTERTPEGEFVTPGAAIARALTKSGHPISESAVQRWRNHWRDTEPGAK